MFLIDYISICKQFQLSNIISFPLNLVENIKGVKCCQQFQVWMQLPVIDDKNMMNDMYSLIFIYNIESSIWIQVVRSLATYITYCSLK